MKKKSLRQRADEKLKRLLRRGIDIKPPKNLKNFMTSSRYKFKQNETGGYISVYDYNRLNKKIKQANKILAKKTSSSIKRSTVSLKSAKSVFKKLQGAAREDKAIQDFFKKNARTLAEENLTWQNGIYFENFFKNIPCSFDKYYYYDKIKISRFIEEYKKGEKYLDLDYLREINPWHGYGDGETYIGPDMADYCIELKKVLDNLIE